LWWRRRSGDASLIGPLVRPRGDHSDEIERIEEKNATWYPPCDSSLLLSLPHCKLQVFIYHAQRDRLMEAKELSPSSEGQGPADRDSAGRRISRACEHCRTRKVRCSGHQPCTNCRQLNRTCIYRVEARQRRKRTGFFKINPDIRPNKPADDDAPPARSAGSLLSTTNNPTLHKKQLELRSGLCVSDHNTGAFQFYGNSRWP
jgi:hypothetical protein